MTRTQMESALPLLPPATDDVANDRGCRAGQCLVETYLGRPRGNSWPALGRSLGIVDTSCRQ